MLDSDDRLSVETGKAQIPIMDNAPVWTTSCSSTAIRLRMESQNDEQYNNAENS